MSQEQALALWRAEIAHYHKVIASCCKHILNPPSRYPPPDFEDKIEQFRDFLAGNDLDDYDKFMDVIVHHIEGAKNISIIQLADKLAQQIGGTIKFWQNAIVDAAEQVTYTSDLTLWEVRKGFDERLYVDAQNFSNYRRLCKIIKSYLFNISYLIKLINKFDIKKDNMQKIDECFKKVKTWEQKYVSYCEQYQGLQPSHTLDQMSNNISQRSKQNAMKELFYFQGPARHEKNKRATLFNYNFSIKNKEKQMRVSGPSRNLKQTGKTLSKAEMQQFQASLKNAKNQTSELSTLRGLFLAEHKKYKKERAPSQVNVTSIWDKDYFFSYVGYPIDTTKFTAYTQPFQLHQFVNYEINSDDEYQDLIGEDVDNLTEISSVSELTQNSFVVSDDYCSDEEANREQIKPLKTNYLGDRWQFSARDDKAINNQPLDVYSMCLVDQKSKLPLIIVQPDEVEEILYRIVDGNDKNGIVEIVSKEKFKISKARIKQFLDKKCRVEAEGGRSIYKIIEFDNAQYRENCSKQSCIDYGPNLSQVAEKQLDQNTQMNEYAETTHSVNSRIFTRLQRKKLEARSEKLQNEIEKEKSKSMGRKSSRGKVKINSS